MIKMAADDHQSNPKQGKTTTTGPVSPNNATKKQPRDRVPVRPELSEINAFLMCQLCSGYLIDATAISECGHTFCKSCILKYLQENNFCPICDVEVKPHLSLRSDVNVQRLVYKLIPGLMLSELRRRKEHAEKKEDFKEKIKAVEAVSKDMALEVNTASDVSTILNVDDVVSLSIEYFRGDGKDIKSNVKTEPKSLKQEPNDSVQDVTTSTKDSSEANDRLSVRYLKCPAALSVGLLKKFIRTKYGLSDDYRVDLLYNGDRDSNLEEDLTLLDLAFIYKWNKDGPMQLQYRIFDRAVKSLPTRAGSKRSAASSMMDEPPDPDAASGPQNRPPMTSSSSSAKVPRVSNNTSTGAGGNAGTTGGSSRSTSTLVSSSPVYDFSEGTSDAEEPLMQKRKLKLRGFRKDSSSNSNNVTSEGGKGSNINKRSPPFRTHISPARTNSVGSQGSEAHSEDADSDSSDSSDEAKVTELTNSRVRSAAQTVLQSQVNANGLKLNIEKREPLKLSLGSVMAKSPEHKHKHKHHKMKHKKKHKPLKLSLSLGSSKSQVSASQSQGTHNKIAGKVVKVEKSGSKGLVLGKNLEGKAGGGNGPTGTNTSNFPVNVKPTTSAHLNNISKNISVSIGVGNNSQNISGGKGSQIPSNGKNLLSKNTGSEKQHTTVSTPTQPQQTNVNSSSNSNQGGSGRTHPLLPESVHVPKSVTLIPVNPNVMGSSSSNNTPGHGRGNSSGTATEKSGSSSGSSGHTPSSKTTFTHPITNKSLHQITVTEVPPPNKPGSNSSSAGGNVGSANNSGPGSTPSSSNPIEKVIANAVNKPQFNGPGSMEITKIYCTNKDNPTKKLKERKGLDISITVPGLSIKDTNKKTSKLEETLRKKIGLTGMTISNKIKGGNSQSQSPIFNAKMPPGITIGPLGTNNKSGSGSFASSNTPGHTISGLGFNLPPQITAHPQQQQQQQQQQPQKNLSAKDNNKMMPKSVLSKGGIGVMKSSKDLINQKVPQQTKQGFVDNRKQQMGEALASMMDMANRNAIKSPSPPKFMQQNSRQETKGPLKSTTSGGNCEKRALDMSSGSRKNSRDSPETKRSKTNETGHSKSCGSEIPLDLSSGRTSRPNSNSSSPVHQLKPQQSSSPSMMGKVGNEQGNLDAKKSPTPVPKVSPSSQTTAPGFTSPSGKSEKKGGSSGSPSILSIAQNLAQKQLNQQQHQKEQQFMHNQLLQLQQMHATLQQSGSKGGSGGSSLSPKGGSLSSGSVSASMGLNSLSPPIISMPNPSPPCTGFDPLRNLLTLSDAATRHGKPPHSMNSLMAAVGLSHHPGMSLPSPTSGNSGSLFPHLVNSLGGKAMVPGLMDPATQAYFAAYSHAHNERLAAAAAAGINPFGDAMSMANSFFSQVRPPTSGNPPGNLRIPSNTVPPKSSASTTNNSNMKKSSPTPPFTSHPPSTSTGPHSPTKGSSPSSNMHSKPLDSSTNIKNTKINGTSFPSHLPLLPPGIHNPLLPNYSRAVTTNALNSGITTSSSSSSTKVTGSDKKGIPNSMKISNFLPSKPKDGKGSDSNVEATITSGSHVGGTSLTKFLNSIPPLIVSPSQQNLSMSPSTLPKDSSRVFSGLNNKSSNEQECHSKSEENSKAFPISPTQQNPIKQEVLDKPIIVSPSPSKTSSTTSPTNKLSPKSSEDASNSRKLVSPSDQKPVPFTLALSSPPSARPSPSQPQNQAVRQIPNTALLFNRRSSHSHSATSPVGDGNANKTISFGQKSPKIDETPLIFPGVSGPGVSIPVQVKVDNDVVPIPISIPVVGNVISPKPSESSGENRSPKSAPPNQITEVQAKEEKMGEGDTGNNSLIAEASSKVLEPLLKRDESSDPICKKEEIVKIEYTADDGDENIDIDVGIESAPDFHPDHQKEEENEVQKSVDAGLQNKENLSSTQQVQGSEESFQVPIEIKRESTCEPEKLVEEKPNSPSSAVQEEAEENETESEENALPSADVDVKVEREPECVQAPEKMELEEEEEEGNVGKEEGECETPESVEGEVETGRESETEKAGEDSEQMDEQGLLVIEEGEKEEIPEMSLLSETLDSSEEPMAGREEMECEEDPLTSTLHIQSQSLPQDDQQCMETDEEKEEEGAQMSEETNQETENVDVSVPTAADDQLINSGDSKEEELPREQEILQEDLVSDGAELAELPVVEGQDAAAEDHELVSECDTTATGCEKTNEGNATELHTADLRGVVQSEDLTPASNSDSIPIPNQISINPEALKVEDTNNGIHTDDGAESAEGKEVSAGIIPLNNMNQEENAVEKLMESSSASQLELNCPSADTNGIELSNPVTTPVQAQTLPENNSSPLHSDDTTHIQSHETNSQEEPVPESYDHNTEEEEPSFAIQFDVDEIYSVENEMASNILDQVETDTGMNPNLTITDEGRSEIDHHQGLSVDEDLSFVISEDMDVEMLELQDVGPSVTNSGLSPALISATATITATSAEMPSSVMEASSVESPVSSRNSLESPTSPEDNVKKMETLEKVAAGLFATNTINNNNNKSLAITTSTCDIPLTTTTSTSDMTV